VQLHIEQPKYEVESTLCDTNENAQNKHNTKRDNYQTKSDNFLVSMLRGKTRSKQPTNEIQKQQIKLIEHVSIKKIFKALAIMSKA